MKKDFKFSRVIAATLIMTTVLSMSVFAQELKKDDQTGIGGVEGIVNQDIYRVVLPTVTDDMLDFIIDPQGIINKTGGAAYGNKKFEKNSTLFFKRSDGKVAEDYSNSSDEITITNRGSVAVKVSLTINIPPESLGGIMLTDDREFTDDKNASFYMALVDGENVLPIGKDGISKDVIIDAAPEEAFEYGYDTERETYTYKMKEDVSGIEFPSYSFQLTGASNENGDWSEFIKESPEITVSWKIVPIE